jgi:hypothetical protein
MRPALFIAFIALTGLCACSSDTWFKSGATDADYARDQRACATAAQKAQTGHIHSDVDGRTNRCLIEKGWVLRATNAAAPPT